MSDALKSAVGREQSRRAFTAAAALLRGRRWRITMSGPGQHRVTVEAGSRAKVIEEFAWLMGGPRPGPGL